MGVMRLALCAIALSLAACWTTERSQGEACYRPDRPDGGPAAACVPRDQAATPLEHSAYPCGGAILSVDDGPIVAPDGGAHEPGSCCYFVTYDGPPGCGLGP